MILFWMIMIGLGVGLLARTLIPRRDPEGLSITITLGIIGALIAGYAGRAFGLYDWGEPRGFVASILGAMATLFIFRRAVEGRA